MWDGDLKSIPIQMSQYPVPYVKVVHNALLNQCNLLQLSSSVFVLIANCASQLNEGGRGWRASSRALQYLYAGE